MVDDIMNESSSEEALQELFVDKETKALIDRWKTGNEVHTRKEFKTSMLSDSEYMKLKEVFKVLHSNTDDYKAYKKAFNALCKAAHIVPDGTIITKYELGKSETEDRNNLYVEYTDNIRPMKLPEGTKLYHQSVVGGIKSLIPKWKLRGKNENGYLCDKPRVYLTMSKSLPRISTDNKLKDRLYTYEVLRTPSEVYVDPLLPDIFQKAVYVETSEPIPVKPVEKDTLFGKIKEKMTGKNESEDKKEEKVSEMVIDTTMEPVNEFFGHGKNNKKTGSGTSSSKSDYYNKIEEEWKKNKNNSLVKKALNDLDNFGESVANKVVEHLKKFASDNNYAKRYPMFIMSDIKYDPINGYDVQITEYQCGWNEDVIDAWEKKNPGKDWTKSKDPELSTDWYYDLLTEGEKCVKDIFNSLNTEGKYYLDCVDTGDGDEGHIYIDISIYQKIKKEILNQINNGGKESMNEAGEISEERKQKLASKKGNINESVELVNEGIGVEIAKGVGKGISIAIGAACKTIVLHVVAVVILGFILMGVSNVHSKKMEDFIAKNPKIKSSIENIVKKVQDLLNKFIKDDAFSTAGYNGFSKNNLKKRATENNTYNGPIGEFRICDIHPDDKDFDTDEIVDPDYGYCFDLDSLEAKNFAKKIKDRYNIFKEIIDQINEKLNDVPNGDIVNLEIIPSFEDDPVFSESEGNFTAQDIVYVTLNIKFKNVNSLEQTSDVVSTKEKLKKRFGKINEFTSIEEIGNVIYESLNIEPVNEFDISKEEKERKTNKKALDDLEFSYDKKYNAFCLSVSGYSIDKLQTTLDKKAKDLEDAKNEKKQATDRQSKLAAQIKVDYLENVCNKCKAMIRKKKSYHNQ